MGLTFAIALVCVIAGSPVHHRNDPLFWFAVLNVAGLIFLSVVLRFEKDEKERVGFIQLFCIGDWVLAVAMAVDVLWRYPR